MKNTVVRLINRLKFRLTPGKERAIRLRFLRSIHERAWDKNVMQSVEHFATRTVANTESYLMEPNQPSWMRATKAFDEEYIYVLSDVIVSSSTGAVWFSDGKIIGESFGSLNRLLSNRAFQFDYFSSPGNLGEEVVALPSTGGFFHFMYESLPAAIVSLEQSSYVKLLIPEKAPKYVRMFAELLSEKPAVVMSGAVAVSRIVVAGKTPYSGFVQKAEIGRIQRFFVDRFPPQAAELKIYISRSRDSRRKLEGEQVLEDSLSSDGFQICILQDMTVSDQIVLFRKAKAVIAPHGAGLSNLIWCNQGIGVIEIFPFKPRNDCYARLSVNLGLDYRYVICQESGKSSGIIPVEEVLKIAARLPA